jgi:hypothetical protein
MKGPAPCGGSYPASCACPVDVYTPFGKSGARQPYLALTAQLSGVANCAPPPVTLIYGNSSTNLYAVDPLSYAVTNMGAFVDTTGQPVVNMTDIAVDKNGAMYGVTFTDLYSINYAGPVPVCTHLGSLSTSFNGLTFVPAALMGTAAEVLVGVSLDGGWWRITQTPTSETLLGYYGGTANAVGSSGDAVGIIGDRVYATATSSAKGWAHDHLIVVDPKTGAMTADLGDTGQTGLWGLGYWGGHAYAFSSNNAIFTIDLTTATVAKVSSAGDPSWWGAAVTTSVNLAPPVTTTSLNAWQLTYDCVADE